MSGVEQWLRADADLRAEISNKIMLVLMGLGGAVTAAGLLLGGLAAGATFLAVLTTTAAPAGTPSLDLPWTLIAAVAAGTVAVTGVTSLLTSWSATGPRPVTLLGARE